MQLVNVIDCILTLIKNIPFINAKTPNIKYSFFLSNIDIITLIITEINMYTKEL